VKGLHIKTVIIDGQRVALYSVDGKAWSSNTSEIEEFEVRRAAERAELKEHLQRSFSGVRGAS
jgi:hypothetical protein